MNRECLTALGGFSVIVDDGEIRGEEVHDRGVDLRFQGLPVNIIVLFAHSDKIRTQEDRFDTLNAKQLSKSKVRHEDSERSFRPRYLAKGETKAD